MIACWFFEGPCFVLTFYVRLFQIFSFVALVVSFFQINRIVFGLGLSCDFLVFYCFFFRLVNSLQKNKLSSF